LLLFVSCLLSVASPLELLLLLVVASPRLLELSDDDVLELLVETDLSSCELLSLVSDLLEDCAKVVDVIINAAASV
jgi:hypothetical protein